MDLTYRYVGQIVGKPEGGTIRLAPLPLPDTGYYVGGIVSPLIVDDVEDPEAMQDLEVFIAYLTGHVRPGFIGWWTDSETGKLYVDATTWVSTGQAAMDLSRQRNEIAFWDIAKDEEVRTS